MKKLSLVFVLIISLAISGCAGMSDTEQRTSLGVQSAPERGQSSERSQAIRLSELRP
jgi:hypothetical protein